MQSAINNIAILNYQICCFPLPRLVMSTLRAYFKPKKARLEDENPEQEPEDVDPVVPVDAVDPFDPVDPVDPVDLFVPVDLIDPVDLVDPVDPVDPVDLVDPVDPVDLFVPADLVDLVDLVDPVDPVDHVNPVDPVEPVDTIEPEVRNVPIDHAECKADFADAVGKETLNDKDLERFLNCWTPTIYAYTLIKSVK